MKSKKIPLLDIDLSDSVLSSQNTFDLTNGIERFENIICDYVGVENGVALSSGTAAIHLALRVLEIKKGDTILCSTFTFAASAFPIKYIGAHPVFIDSENDTWNMCPLLLEKAILEEIKNNKKPKAIILVHTYGGSAKIEEIVGVSEKYMIPIIEDAAEALGSLYKDKACGTFGDLGILSFNKNKILTTLGGGMLISNNKKYINRARYFALQAKENTFHYEHLEVGYNYRINPIAASVGISQMENFQKEIEAKRRVFCFYKNELDIISNISFLKEAEFSYSNCWLNCVLLESSDMMLKIVSLFESENIEVRPLWKPMHQQQVFKNERNYLNGVSDKLFKKGLCLPSSSTLTKHDLQRVVTILKKALSSF